MDNMNKVAFVSMDVESFYDTGCVKGKKVVVDSKYSCAKEIAKFVDFLEKYENAAQIAPIFRILGRLSFPLIIFLLVEGIRHTKDIKKYFIRLGLVAFAFLVGQLFFYYILSNKESMFLSPAIDLLLATAFITSSFE